MGNASDCCSDGVLVPGKFNYPNNLTEGLPQFGGGAGPDTNNLVTMDGNSPTVPILSPSAANMDGVSTRTTRPGQQDDGPYEKDGVFVEINPQLSTGSFNLQPLTIDQSRERGRQYNPFKFHKTRHTYIGDWKRHKFHGQGILIFENGDYLIGTFRNGSPIGRCRLLLFSQNCFYEGQMQNWHAQGDGIFKMQNNSYSYQGRFHDSNADGFGIEQTPTSKYQGLFKAASKVKGVLAMQGGYTYDGEFQNDQFHGFGKLISPNGQYNGEFVNGKKNGTGIFRWKDGSYYEGEYKSDLKHGRGKYVSADRMVVHQGQWRAGKYIGTEMGGGGISGSSRLTSPLHAGSSLSQRSVSPSPPAFRPSAPRITGVSTYRSNPGLDPASSKLTSTSGNYVSPSSLLVPPTNSAYVPAGSNYMPPNITVTGASQYAPGSGIMANSQYVSGTSNYNPGSNLPAGSNYSPPSRYTPQSGVLTGDSNLSFRGNPGGAGS